MLRIWLDPIVVALQLAGGWHDVRLHGAVYSRMMCCHAVCVILQVGVLSLEPAFVQAVIAAAPQWLPAAGPATVSQVRNASPSGFRLSPWV
jgi:hypothetical protein